MYNFSLTDDAKSDIREIRSYYFSQGGRNLLIKFEKAREKTETMLERWPGVAKIYEPVPGVFKYKVSKFPYTIYMIKQDNNYKIIAFSMFHQRRDPEKIKELILQRLKTQNSISANKAVVKGFTLPPHQAKSFYAKTNKTTKQKTNNKPNINQNHNRGLTK